MNIAPHVVLKDFLLDDECRRIWDYTVDHEQLFKPAVLNYGVHDERLRRSLSTRELGPAETIVRDAISKRLPSLISQLRLRAFTPRHFELELAAHNDGDFFARHLDTRIGSDAAGKSARLLSAVYYFFQEPKTFSGGELRLFKLGPAADRSSHQDITPLTNMLLAFPSWAAHEVLPVRCPSKKFVDSRFAINCWVHGAP